MARFTYKAVGADGAFLQGDLEAPSFALAVGQLQARGATPLRLQPIDRRSVRALLRSAFGTRTLPYTALVEFLQRLATLLSSGVSVEDALSILERHRGASPIQHLAQDLLHRLREGAHLADAMEEQAQTLPLIAIGMVRAGEISGALTEALARLAEYMQRTEATRQAVRSALIYPTILLLTAGFSILTILLVVLPALKPAIMNGGNALPLATTIAFKASDFVSSFGWVLLLGLIVIGISLRHLASDHTWRRRFDVAILRQPWVGHAVQQAEIGRFARTLGLLVDGGVALPIALALAQPVVATSVMAEAIAKVRERLREGEGLAEPLAQTGQFPDLAIQLIQIGEATGRLGSMLGQLAEMCENELRRTLERGLAVLVPALTIGLGLFVAGVVASVVLALLNVNDFIK